MRRKKNERTEERPDKARAKDEITVDSAVVIST